MDNITNLKLPNCSICSLPFSLDGFMSNNTIRIPLLLHCAHAACENCIICNLRGKNFITCLVCKKVSSINTSCEDSDILSQFPIDNTLCGLCYNKANSISIQSDTHIGFIKPVNKKKDISKTKLCHECQDNRAEVLCNQCTAPYCQTCFKKVHLSARTLRDHTSTGLNESVNNSSCEDVRNIQCKEHETHNLEFYCEQCDETICSRCLLASHNGHQVKELLQKNQELRSAVIESYVRVSNIQRRLLATKKETKQLLQSGKKKDSSSVEVQVRDFFLKLHGQLALFENRIMNEIRSAKCWDSLNDVINELTSHIDETDHVLEVTKTLLNNQIMGSVNYKNLLSLLQSKENIPCFVVKDTVDNNITFKYDPNVFNNLEEICSLNVKQKAQYKLLRENELPDNFRPEEIDEITVHELEASLVVSKQVDEVSSVKSSMKSTLNDSKSKYSSDSSLSSVSVSSSVIDVPTYSLNSDELVPGVTVQVTIIHLISPSDFYIQRHGVHKRMCELQTQLRRCAAGKHHYRLASHHITKGAMFMVYSDNENCWYRARIVELINDKEVKVHYIDYGNTDIVRKERLKPVSPNVKSFPPLALRCKLANCQPIDGTTWDPQAVAVMTQITNSYSDSMVITVLEKTHQFYEVDMVRYSDLFTFNVAETLVFLNLAVTSIIPKQLPTSSMQATSSHSMKTMPPRLLLKKGSIFEVNMAYVIDPDHFYIIVRQSMYKGAKKILEMQEELQHCYGTGRYNNLAMFNPRPGIYVAAKHSIDKLWYRAEILAIPDAKMIKVFYIDIGYTEILSWKNVKVLSSKFYKIPPQAHRCCLSDIKPLVGDLWDHRVSVRLLEITANYSLKAMIDAVNGESVSIILYKTSPEADVCINALLVRENLALSTGVNSTVVEFPKLYQMPTNDNTFQCDVTVDKPVAAKKVAAKPVVPPQVQLNNDNFFMKTTNGCLKIQVDIRRIIDPGEFFVTLCYVKQEIKELEENIQKFYNNLECEPFVPKNWPVDCRCATKIGDKWFRAIIQEPLPEDHYRVFIPDEGIEDIVSGKYMRELDELFRCQRDGASKCHLGGLVPALEKWSKTSITEFEEFVKNNAGSLYITKMSQSEAKSGSLPVELFKRTITPAGPLEAAKDNWTSFNHYLRMVGLAKSDSVTKWDVDGNIISDENQEDLNKPENDTNILQEILSSSFKKYVQIENPEPVMADIHHVAVKWLPPEPITALEFIGTPTFIDDECYIYIQDFMKSTLTLPQICDDLTKRFDDTLPTAYDLRWTPGDICAAQYFIDKKWYRGLIKKVLTEEVASVLFVDYGNVDPVQVTNLRKKPSMTHIPIQAIKFKLHTIAPVHSDNRWKRSDLDNMHSSVSTKNCRVELEVIAGGFGVKRLINSDGVDFIAEWVSKRWARYANEPLIEYLLRTKQETEDVAVGDEQQYKLEADDGGENEAVHSVNSNNINEDADGRSDDCTDAEVISDDGEEYDEDDEKVEVDSSSELAAADSCSYNEEALYKILHWSCITDSDSNLKSVCKYEQLELTEEFINLSVEVTAVLSALEIVVTVNKTDNEELVASKEEFLQLSTIIQESAVKQPLLEAPYKYKMCCAKFSEDDNWYRAFVLEELANETILIQYIDYGNVEVLNADQVHSIPDEWTIPKAQSLLCSLDNIQVNHEFSRKDIMTKLSNCLSQTVLEANIKRTSLVNKIELFNSDGSLAYQSLIDEGILLRTDLQSPQ